MKKVVSLFLAVIMVISCISVTAGYPTDCLVPPTDAGTESTIGNITNDNSAYAFTYATQNNQNASFVLLDKDESGNYLMATNHLFLNDDFVFDTDVSDGWQYNPEDEENVAYWVNTYLHDGSGRALHYIGSNIREHLVEKTWKIEAAPNQGFEERTITAKAVLPSYTEYKTYQTKLNASNAYKASNYIWLRTPSNESRHNGADSQIVYRISTATGALDWTSATNATKKAGVQLFFWVNADFFKDLKVGNIGSEVAKQIKADVTKAELEELDYTEDELRAIGFTGAEPEVSGVAVQGIASVAQTLTAKYTYTDPNGSDKSKVECQWYYADSADGALKKITGETDETYVVSADMLGKYIAVSVRVYNSENEMSAIVKSAVVGPVTAREDIVVTPVSINDTKAEFIIDSVETTNMLLLYCVYNKTTGALMHCEPLTQPVTSGRNTYDVDITGKYTVTSDHIVKAMVWDSWSTLRPYAMIEK